MNLAIAIIYILIIILIILVLIQIKATKEKNNINDLMKLKNELDQSIINANNILGVKLDTVVDNNQRQVSSLNQNIDNKLDLVSQSNVKNLNLVTQSIEQKVSNHNLETMSQLKNTILSLENKLNNQSKNSELQIQEVIKQISKLDSMQGQVQGLNESIVGLNNILNDKKSRGNFGEIRLQHILEAVFGDNESLWAKQVKLSNGKLVDFMIFAPEPIGQLCIDSKFPLENYLRMENEEDNIEYKKAFKADIKKHVDDISNKYIIMDETANQAIMFIPSESIYSEIYANHEDLVTYSYKHNVWIASPTTLMAIVNILMAVIRDIKRNENSQEIQKELNKLKVEFDRFEVRWNTITKDVKKIYSDVNDVDITTNKIIKKFNDISEVELD